MTTEKDLINAVRDSLEADGKLRCIKAEMRSEVLKLLDHSSKSSRTNKCEMPSDVLLLNELIREYFDWIGYKYTLNVFMSECDSKKQSLDRSLAAQSLGIEDNEGTKKLPLLFCLTETFKKLKNT
ncbi:centrosomal protein 20 [Cotesia typhae]|uniref:centrosomal protein 20 n=1 Tax=Cotesia typhae TaxID=2053667 RepID=UPI003D69A793